MHREDNSKYLLYIEPDPGMKSENPKDDQYTKMLEDAITQGTEGSSNYSDLNDKGSFYPNMGYRGQHWFDGQGSTNVDYLIDGGYITNSLAPYYMRWYRDVIPQTEIRKIVNLARIRGVKP